MASIGHVFVGLALARFHDERTPAPQPSLRTRVACALAFPALALLPDADVVAFKLGIPYEDAFGHRGASHSLVFGVAVGLIAALALSRVTRATFALSAVACVLAVVSHCLLDSLTDGGLGVALFWPLTDERYFAPWNPIPVAPIGKRFFTSTWGLRVAATEVAFFAPFLAYALWPRQRRRQTAP